LFLLSTECLKERRELIAYLPVSKSNRVSEHSARAGEVFPRTLVGLHASNRGVQKCLVYPKGNRYLANWYDRKGRRRRKSFTTPEAAQAYEDVQNATARPKVQRGGLQSQKLSHLQPPEIETPHHASHSKAHRNLRLSPARAISARRTSASSTRGPTVTRTISRSIGARV
jgi:hypothetical protein